MIFPHRLRRTSALLALLISAGAVTACTTPPPTATPAETGAASEVVEEVALPLRVAVVGDSNTTGFKTTLADGIDAGAAWISLVPQAQIKYAGGWAQNGATSTAMRENIKPLQDVDVLVIMAGTNNIAMGMPDDVLAADLTAIAATVGARHTVLSSIPPFDARPEDATVLNARLASLASANGWSFMDPWATLRTPAGKWMDIYRLDGLHTTPDGYQTMALALRDQLVAAFAAEASATASD